MPIKAQHPPLLPLETSMPLDAHYSPASLLMPIGAQYAMSYSLEPNIPFDAH